MKRDKIIIGSRGSKLALIYADKAKAQLQKEYPKEIEIKKIVTVGDENQKSGIVLSDFESFYKKMTEDFDLNIIGLMCIPPFVDDTKKYFEKMIELKSKTNLKELSMGMSNDYIEAAKYSSTYVRIGSKIFGSRS